MGRTTMPGIRWEKKSGNWTIDKVIDGVRLRRDFGTDYGEAEAWLIQELGQRREQKLFGTRKSRTFAELATHYLADHEHKASIVTEISLLKTLMPYVAELPIDEVCNDSFKPYIVDRREAGRKNKTINLALAVARRMLNLAARKYREGKLTWLATPPLIEMLPLTDQRPPYQLSWPEQRKLLPELPTHLARMALFALNTGARDDVVCSLRWEWEVPLPEFGVSVFIVPKQHVKGTENTKRDRVLVLNRVAQSVIESVRGQHEASVFVYRKIDKHGEIRACHPVDTMNNTAWQNARERAGLPDLHVHDLRHTVGMRLREAGVGEETRADLLWHKRDGMPAHYSVGQIAELHKAIELVTDERNCNNRTLSSIVREAQEARDLKKETPKSPRSDLLERKTG